MSTNWGAIASTVAKTYLDSSSDKEKQSYLDASEAPASEPAPASTGGGMMGGGKKSEKKKSDGLKALENGSFNISTGNVKPMDTGLQMETSPGASPELQSAMGGMTVPADYTAMPRV